MFPVERLQTGALVDRKSDLSGFATATESALNQVVDVLARPNEFLQDLVLGKVICLGQKLHIQGGGCLEV